MIDRVRMVSNMTTSGWAAPAKPQSPAHGRTTPTTRTSSRGGGRISPKARQMAGMQEAIAKGRLPPPKQCGMTSARTEYGHFKNDLSQVSRNEARQFKRNWIAGKSSCSFFYVRALIQHVFTDEREKNQHLVEVQHIMRQPGGRQPKAIFTDRRLGTGSTERRLIADRRLMKSY